eukprot:12094869-Alexandrium_andersonii.AAC.1
MDRACAQVVAATGDDISHHRAPGGWFSHAALAQALSTTVPPTARMLNRRAREEDWPALLGNPAFRGAVANLNNRHWVALVKHQGLVFYVDSQRAP